MKNFMLVIHLLESNIPFGFCVIIWTNIRLKAWKNIIYVKTQICCLLLPIRLIMCLISTK
jgi:hypothetical protein